MCKFFNTPRKCWQGDRCRYSHDINPSGETLGRVPVYALDEDQSEILPVEGSTVVVDVSTVLSPGHFYVHLPWGKAPIEQIRHNPQGAVKRLDDEETLEDLVHSMNEFYSRKSCLDTDYTLLAPGQAVAARCPHTGTWYRAKVADTRVEEEKVEVFFADFGNTTWVDERNVRELQPEFLHLPQQAVECFLSAVRPPAGQWSEDARNYFHQLVDGKTLVAFVKSRSWSGCLHIDLYDTGNAYDVNIASHLVSASHAVDSGTRQGQTNRQQKETSTERKILLMPG